MKTPKKLSIAEGLENVSDREFLKLSAAELSALGERLSKAPSTRMGRAERNRVEGTLEAIRKQRGPGRPRVGQGARSVLVSLERGLLAEADQYAKRQKLSRSELIAIALKEKMRRKAG